MNSSIPESHLLLCGSYIYQTPPESPDLSGLRIIHPGYWLGKLKSGLFEPAHSLAMATLPQEARQMLNLDSQSLEMIDFLQGKILQSPGDNGWVLITVDGYSLGWGKRIRGILKNYYPRGLRWL
jgi:NOL1/NOP2/fmu family ribosome biogenesis protein